MDNQKAPAKATAAAAKRREPAAPHAPTPSRPVKMDTPEEDANDHRDNPLVQIEGLHKYFGAPPRAARAST